MALGAGAQVVGAPLVKAAGMNVQFEGRRLGREMSGPDWGAEVADERRGNTVGELEFFRARKRAGRWIFRFETDTGQGLAGLP